MDKVLKQKHVGSRIITLGQKVPTSVAETDTHENKVLQLECIVRASSMCGLLVIKKQFQTHYTCLKMED